MPKKDTGVLTGTPSTYALPCPAGGVQMETFVPWKLVKRGVKRRIVTPPGSSGALRLKVQPAHQARSLEQISPLLRSLGLAHYWQSLLEDGTFSSVTQIALAEGLDLAQASRIWQLTRLAPELVDLCLGSSRSEHTLAQITRACLASTWAKQVRLVKRESKTG